ncbi:MAG: hypothetical protein KZQ72_16495, partial [Candidatus Thiodiazotropha sp. (ex Cardiolucina cf. quadrata)]|nr:hypothetical protein [Candidatus Thiodiazotropha sp. (ex Cardiolucina cf. quadrata)]
ARHAGSTVSPHGYRGLTASAFSLPWRSAKETTFVIVLTSQKLLEHFEQRLEGMPVQFIQHLRTQ